MSPTVASSTFDVEVYRCATCRKTYTYMRCGTVRHAAFECMPHRAPPVAFDELLCSRTTGDAVGAYCSRLRAQPGNGSERCERVAQEVQLDLASCYSPF